uniref:hypothetical protein n=1 Tax=Rhizobium sp. TaxID=391 RepID=UPI00289C84CD
MRNAAKLASTTFFSLVILGFSLSAANALQVGEPTVNVEAGERRAATAYAEDGQGASSQKPSILSKREIAHIKWCAARYRLAYDPVND